MESPLNRISFYHVSKPEMLPPALAHPPQLSLEKVSLRKVCSALSGTRGQKGDSDREAEQPVDKLQLGEGVAFGHPSDSSLSNDVNRLDALQDPPRRPERLIPSG